VKISHSKAYVKKFGLNLRKIRIQKKLSQADLAFSCNFEISQISRIERGIINTSVANIYILSIALKVHPKELLDF
jgi:transcriptional regulator with XRE-family HTH domain